MPDKRPGVKNEKQYEKLKEKGMSKERAARIANSPGASSRGGKRSGSGSSRSSSSQGGTTAQKKAAGRETNPGRARSDAARAASRSAVPSRGPRGPPRPAVLWLRRRVLPDEEGGYRGRATFRGREFGRFVLHRLD